MIAADTSSLIAFFSGTSGTDVDAIQKGFEQSQIALPPVVLSELLSAPNMTSKLAQQLIAIQQLKLAEKYWIRVGELRRTLLKKKQKARLADTMIAQSCIDHDIPLITRDRDFQKFVPLGLQLAIQWH